jgi:uncharacterized protein (TIGR02147 family)
MLSYRKESEPGFSVRKAVASISGCSPSLVTQVALGRRKLTRERVEMFASLLKLNRQELLYLDQWVATERAPGGPGKSTFAEACPKKRSGPQNQLLSDWLNVYVKDACGLEGFQPDPVQIHRILGGIAPIKRIEKSLSFLLKEGFLRRTVTGKTVVNDAMVMTSDDVPSEKIRKFHKKALDIASRSIDCYPVTKRRANAIVLPLNDSSLPELNEILKRFYEELLTFGERHAGENERLYQILLNFTPVGGTRDH